jgi:hypothetical protein
MLNLAIVVPSWLMTLLLFQFTYIQQTVVHSFLNITPARIHQSLAVSVQFNEVILYLSPLKTTQDVSLLISESLNRLSIDYQLTFTYFSGVNNQLCSTQCSKVTIDLTYTVYGFEFNEFVQYQVVRNEN